MTTTAYDPGARARAEAPGTAPAPAGGGTALHRFTLLLVAATVLLLVAGSLVTSTSSGDAVPDWWFVPISYGTLFPPAVGAIWIEHGHRLVASLIGLLTIVLAVWLGRSEERAWVRRLGYAALAGVCLQGCLGGIRVLQLLPPKGIAIVHACVAQAFFCLTASLALFTSAAWRRGEASLAAWSEGSSPRLAKAEDGLKRLALATTCVLFLQLVAGAVMRHTGTGLIVHVAGAALVTCMVSMTAGRVVRWEDSSPALLGAAQALGLALLVQLGLGVTTFAFLSEGATHSYRTPALTLAVMTGHVVVGALLLAGSLVVTLLAHRPWLVVGGAAESAAVATAGGRA
ncbi:MAG: COX15/CtaA family protein [Planctomycetes bacterium]|nr:COX15/CtaA family protein [Planctomycetota bacterium]